MSALGISFMTSKNKSLNLPITPTQIATTTYTSTANLLDNSYSGSTLTISNSGMNCIGPTWQAIAPWTTTTVAYAPQMLTLKMRHKSSELALAEKLAGIADRAIRNVSAVEYKLQDGEETLHLELLSDGQTYSSIYKALYEKDFYLVLDEAAGASSTARVIEIMEIVSMTSSSNATTGLVGRLSIAMTIKSIALEINDNGRTDIIKL